MRYDDYDDDGYDGNGGYDGVPGVEAAECTKTDAKKLYKVRYRAARAGRVQDFQPADALLTSLDGAGFVAPRCNAAWQATAAASHARLVVAAP